MAYRERLVRSCEEVVQSTKSFNRGLNEEPDLYKRLSGFRAWYYIPEIDDVGPSKFIGYREISARFYLDHTGTLAKATFPSSKRLNGGTTENRLKKWFEETEPGTVEYEYVSEMTKELLDQWGKKPSKLARYCVPKGYRRTG